MFLISVIIPVYNGAKTIRKTIESVLNQTFLDFELIVINDGSQDATLEIVDSFKDSRLKVFSYPNTGPSQSRNRGISHASGKYISFIDADDVWRADKLEAQLQVLHANPQATVAYSWTDYIDESGQFLRRGAHISVTGDVFKYLLLANFLENGSNPLICAHALAEVGGFDESLTHAEDWDMWLRLAAHYQFVAVPSPQIFYRVYDNSSSSNVFKLEAGCLQVINRAFTQSPESLQYLKRHSIANIYKYLTNKALEGVPQRRRSLVAVRFLICAVSKDPSLLSARVLLKVLLKIVVITLLPSHLAQALLTKVGKLSNIEALHGYLQLEPSQI